MAKLNDRTGETNINTYGLNMKIIACRSAIDLDIQFDDGYISRNKSYGNFKKGIINNPYFKSVHGIGFIGEGKYKTSINGKHTIQCETWYDIFNRCYSEKYQLTKSTYKDCTVCDEWHNFQNFAEWFDENYYTIDNEFMNLDKDILIKGNKIYSPETCVFVSNDINMLFAKADKIRGKYPIGVHYDKERNKYKAFISKYNKNVFLGRHDTPKKAFEVYKIEKEFYIKEIADLYKDKIPEKLYNAMYAYQVEITD